MEFTDLLEINTLNLNKLPPDDDSTDLWYWMKFIKNVLLGLILFISFAVCR